MKKIEKKRSRGAKHTFQTFKKIYKKNLNYAILNDKFSVEKKNQVSFIKN